MVAKKFIAGAKCPVCKELDTIYMVCSYNKETYKCVDCKSIVSMQQIQSKKVKDKSTKKYDVIRIIES